MANLKAKKKIINLGKLFVKELNLEPGNDTLSRWMVHYIAEKMYQIENSKAKAKAEIEKDCFETILKLWKHRYYILNGKKPLQNFEQILELLNKLNPNNKETYFYKSLKSNSLDKLEKENSQFKYIELLTNLANDIDKVARIWIDLVLAEIARVSLNSETKNWIKNAIDLQDNKDINIVIQLAGNNVNIGSKKNKNLELEKQRKETIKKRIKELRKFSKINKFFLAYYKRELEN
ncbi:MAG TPA: hypothetical protein DIS94_03055 [Bacteroidetes bacterium]|nr:hypothetical protein [Bacteroidota bacterium]